jgi:hypothetical protein
MGSDEASLVVYRPRVMSGADLPIELEFLGGTALGGWDVRGAARVRLQCASALSLSAVRLCLYVCLSVGVLPLLACHVGFGAIVSVAVVAMISRSDLCERQW